MKVFMLEAEIGEDGILHLELATGLPPGKVKVVIVIQEINPGDNLMANQTNQHSSESSAQLKEPESDTNHLP